MRTAINAILFIVVPTLGLAASVYPVSKKCHAGDLTAALVAASYGVVRVDCVGDRGTIYLNSSEKKDPAPVISSYTYVDPQIALDSRAAQVAALKVKLSSKTITADETNQLLLLITP